MKDRFPHIHFHLKALFAIGNIALDVSQSNDENFIRALPLIQLCDTTYQRLFDDGEKVRED